MKKFRFLVLCCFVTIVSCKENKTEAQNKEVQKAVNEKVIALQFKTKIENKEVQLVDVRTPKEFVEGHINTAKNINFFDKDFVDQMNALNKNKPLYIYCRSGNRSGKAAVKLIEAGFKEIYDLKGGFLDWQAAKLLIKK